jgi:hypothetical protein
MLLKVNGMLKPKESKGMIKKPRHQQIEFEVYLELKHRFEIKMNEALYCSQFYHAINR